MTNALTISSAEPFFIPGGKTGCLLLHGFTGTPKEMRLLGESLAADGYTVLAPRLFAHATDPADMPRARWRDWLASAEDGLNLLKGCTQRQVVMGLSMGGILSMITAAHYNVAGAVSFSTPCDLPAAGWQKLLLPLLGPLNLHIGKGKPDWRESKVMKDHIDYPYYPTRAVFEMNKLTQVMLDELNHVRVPVLFVQSKGDESIPPHSMDYLYEHVSSIDKTRLWVQNSGHVVIGEPEREKIFSEVKSFLKRIA
jgi:carboxylesterase